MPGHSRSPGLASSTHHLPHGNARRAKKTGEHIEYGQRFGLHNFRRSLGNWLVNKAKVEPKTLQGILRHAKIQKTLDRFTQDDSDETRAAQGKYLTALGVAALMVQ